MRATNITMTRGCKHKWQPFTIHKAKCSKCGRRTPWVDLVDAAENRGWIRGLGYSIAEVVRAHDIPTVAADIANASGCDLGDFVRAELDAYDMKTLRKVARDEGRRWPQRSSRMAQ